MRISRQHAVVLGIVAAIVAWSAVCLWPELSVSRIDLNDNVSHYAYVERIVQTIERGGNPLDTWSPEWTFGFPMLRVYQPLAHLLVAGLYFLFAKSVSLMTLFVWVRFLAVVLLPLSFYATARLFELSRPTALAAAIMSPLISSAGLFGLEYGSYVWAGNGLFPQSVAAHLFLLSLGFDTGQRHTELALFKPELSRYRRCLFGRRRGYSGGNAGTGYLDVVSTGAGGGSTSQASQPLNGFNQRANPGAISHFEIAPGFVVSSILSITP